MTGLPTLAIALDDGSGAFAYDITSKVRSWSLSSGRGDEMAGVEPAQLTLELDNNDGRFSLAATTIGTAVVVDMPVRVTETVGGTPYVRFTGYVQSWPTSWANETGLESRTQVTATDRQARLARRVSLSAAQAEAKSDGATRFYALAEEVGSTTAGDTSGNAGPPLAITGSGTTPTFGSAGPTVDTTGVAFDGTGRYLACSPKVGTALALDVTWKGTQVGSNVASLYWPDPANPGLYIGLSIGIRSPSGSVYMVTPGGSNTIAGNGADGAWHHAMVRWDGSAWVAEVDGAEYTGLLGTTAPTAIPDTAILEVGGGTGGKVFSSAFAGTVANVGIYPTGLSLVAAQQHYAAELGTTVESSSTRMVRLAKYAGVATGDQVFEAGILAATATQSLAGQQAWSTMTDVALAEGGSVFFRGDGKLVFQNRNHRTLKATGAAAVALTSGDVEADINITADKQYLYNVGQGSRLNGADQIVRNTTSIAKYDEYPTTDLSSLLVTTDAEVVDRLNWAVGMYGDVSARINSVTIDLLAQATTATVQGLLGLTFGDRITVSGLPSQSPIATADLIVEGVGESQAADSWTLTLNTSASSLYRAWISGDATYGVSGVTTRPSF